MESFGSSHLQKTTKKRLFDRQCFWQRRARIAHRSAWWVTSLPLQLNKVPMLTAATAYKTIIRKMTLFFLSLMVFFVVYFFFQQVTLLLTSSFSSAFLPRMFFVFADSPSHFVHRSAPLLQEPSRAMLSYK